MKGSRNKRLYFGKNQMLWDLGLDAKRMEDVDMVARIGDFLSKQLLQPFEFACLKIEFEKMHN